MKLFIFLGIFAAYTAQADLFIGQGIESHGIDRSKIDVLYTKSGRILNIIVNPGKSNQYSINVELYGEIINQKGQNVVIPIKK